MELIFHHDSEPPLYVAVSEYGFGMDRDPVKAILLAQESVLLKDKPRQLLLYKAHCPWEDEEPNFKPVGFKNGEPQWSNGVRPKLVGLTNTHQGFVKRPRI